MNYRKPLDQTDPDAPYVDANPVYDLEGSIIPAYALEAPQREIVNAIKAILGSGAPDAEDLTQLKQALQAVAAAASDLANATGTLSIPKGGTSATTAADALAALGGAPTSHIHTVAQITNFPSSMPASDVYSWAKQSSKPSYTASEVGAAPASAVQPQYAALITSSGTWVAPYAGKYKFTLVGGGGGGGIYAAGSGGYTVLYAELAQNVSNTVTIGGGGPKASAMNSGGSNGGDTSFMGAIATGGKGGGGSNGSIGAGGVSAGNDGSVRVSILSGYGYGGTGGQYNQSSQTAGGQGCVLVEYLGA